MVTKELIDALEEKRELLKETIYHCGMDLSNSTVLAYSQELDDLITAYLSTTTKRGS